MADIRKKKLGKSMHRINTAVATPLFCTLVSTFSCNAMEGVWVRKGMKEEAR
jgi:hypothetical protein